MFLLNSCSKCTICVEVNAVRSLEDLLELSDEGELGERFEPIFEKIKTLLSSNLLKFQRNYFIFKNF
jgi:hypothetical protein